MRTSAADQSFSASRSKSETMARIESDFGPWLERLIGKLGVTQTEAAEAIGVARQTFAAKALTAGKLPRLSWLYALPEAVRVAIAADLVGDDYVVVKRTDADASTSDHFARFGRITTKAAALTTTYAKSLSDGQVDIVEEREVRDAIAEVVAEGQAQMHAIDERQRGLKVVGGGAK